MSALFCTAFVLLVLLAVHHFIKARRGLRTGVVEGLILGYSGKHYSWESDPDAFWVNVYAGFFVATLGAVALLWTVLVTAIWIGDRFFGLAPL